MGSNATYADGHWQGYWGDSIDAVIDFGKPTAIHKVSMRFMQNTFDWILAPKEIKVYASNDGKDWHLVADQHFGMDPRETGMRLHNYRLDLNSQFSIPPRCRSQPGSSARLASRPGAALLPLRRRDSHRMRTRGRGPSFSFTSCAPARLGRGRSRHRQIV